MSRAGIVCTCVNRPLWIKQCLSSFNVDQIHICVIVALEICDGSKESTMGNSADIQIIVKLIDNIS